MFLPPRESQQVAVDAERILRRWNFAVHADGRLKIEPPGPELSTGDLLDFVRFFSRQRPSQRWREFTLDLRRVQRFGDNWTLLVAILLEFVRRMAISGRIVGLHDQPGAVLRLYRRTPEVAELIADANVQITAA
jgi:hypothetical protein